MTVYSTENMMKFLDKSKANGWQVVIVTINMYVCMYVCQDLKFIYVCMYIL